MWESAKSPVVFSVLVFEAQSLTVWGIAFSAVALMAGAWALSRRRKKGRLNRGAIACAIVSMALHIALLALLPYTAPTGGGPVSSERPFNGVEAQNHRATLSTIELVDTADDQPSDLPEVELAPLDLALQTAPVMETPTATFDLTEIARRAAPDHSDVAGIAVDIPDVPLPEAPRLDNLLETWLDDLDTPADVPPAAQPAPEEIAISLPDHSQSEQSSVDSDGLAKPVPPVSVDHERLGRTTSDGRVVGHVRSEFANRYGAAKKAAIIRGGGDESTEAAVAAGLQFLARYQKNDGSWDPKSSGAGVERSVLGQHRSGAGARATTGITGLALLSMLGSGSTHNHGEYANSLRSGLQYLVNIQEPDGSLAADADHFAKTYCHGMAALALCETATLTQDPVALSAAASAVRFTLRSQHPSTGGWRYVPGDSGDMSQLGWQAMVLASAQGAGIEVPSEVLLRVERFLRSVRAGKTGGLASYKPGEAPSRTMTAESLAVRLLLGMEVPAEEISEAETFILEELPGGGLDNYYYWYYASLALHQLKRPSWDHWNSAMKSRLLESQLADGSWPTNTVWGGHGGKVYTTAMACLCLEVYYRHMTIDERGTVQTAANSQFLRR